MKYIIEHRQIGELKETSGYDNPYKERLIKDYNYETDEIESDSYKFEYEYYYGYPEEIDIIIDMLENLKSNGATHISIDYHEDHGSYLIQGLKIGIKKEN